MECNNSFLHFCITYAGKLVISVTKRSVNNNLHIDQVAFMQHSCINTHSMYMCIFFSLSLSIYQSIYVFCAPQLLVNVRRKVYTRSTGHISPYDGERSKRMTITALEYCTIHNTPQSVDCIIFILPLKRRRNSVFLNFLFINQYFTQFFI